MANELNAQTLAENLADLDRQISEKSSELKSLKKIRRSLAKAASEMVDAEYRETRKG